MEFKVFIGVDVSKDTLDFAVKVNGQFLFHQKTDNNKKGIHSFFKQLSAKVEADSSAWLFCMEHTGIYCNPLIDFLARKSIAAWLEQATAIKTFHSTERGKNDALDAQRIADYAYTKRHKVRLWEAPREVMKQLKSLIKLRNRLITTKNSLLQPLEEEKNFIDKHHYKEQKKYIKPVIDKINHQIKEVESQIQEIIQADEYLKHLYELITSVSGVGKVIAVNTLVVTNEFKQINEAKKMACHCGVAPFEHSSGKSIKGRPKVSHRADKQMKKLFHMAAMSAINSPGELQDYYLRKVTAGKNKMAVINALRNKIIHRIFACVRDNRKYEKTYTHALA